MLTDLHSLDVVVLLLKISGTKVYFVRRTKQGLARSGALSGGDSDLPEENDDFL
jgi:hypothetical protein